MICRISMHIPTLILLILTGGGAQAVDFYYEIANPYAANAEDHLISQSNVMRITEDWGGGRYLTYYSPSVQTGRGVMLYKFDFDAPSSQIILKFRLSAFNFGSSFGDISLSGSRNGTDYSIIASLPKPIGIDSFLDYNQVIGPDFIGTNSLYLKVEMNVVGWNIMSQWLRHDTTWPFLNPIFAVTVNYVPEPSSIFLSLVAVGGVVVTGQIRGRRRKARRM